MKKRITALLCACLALLSAGCSVITNDATEPSTTAAPDVVIDSPTEPYHSPDIEEPMHAIVLPSVSESTFAEDGAVIFTRSYQKIQLILNGTDIDDVIAADLQTRMTNVFTSTADVENYAKDDYTASEYWTPYFVDVTYTPTRIDKAILSLFGNHSSYAGGPHPSLVTESVTYDLTSGAVLALGDILVDGYSGKDLSALISTSLTPMASELYYDYETVLQDRFSGDYDDITAWYFSQTGLCFHFSPYDIAPYSSGTIIAEIPYESLSGILEEQYFPANQADATGSVYAEMYLDDDEERFSFIADVELDKDGTKILLHPDATVTDLRIETGVWYSDNSQYVPVSTIFAADSVGLGNAITLTADFLADGPTLRLVYHSGGQEVSAFIAYDTEGDSIILTNS